ncbi:tyrosine--tRNA ligase [Taibaiella sp. KBW10]|uniref:tyrosine--tRNA ligase n=1 Tax=Taibaiella sp. KBW10 TaxID=2153357 RepID=UPI000F594D94|nr:tyrosine--tRNA ligase [Taibaiella sp. KBW10]RQO31826.1 tyrosine--tRNA ligase [Taibaiella sp. KBW10]
MKNFIPELRERGLLQDMIPGTEELLAKEVVSAYVGFDPTADSLHIGSMLPIILLKHLQLSGHKPIALIGGATGMIGDPTGKSAERNLLDEATIDKNIAGIRKQLEKFIDFDETLSNKAEIVNNNDWIGQFSFLDFIRDVGKHITVNYMLAKDSVQKRLEFGLSFTEFTYQLIQGYDFFHLYKNMGVKLQFGGGDQWGNIVTGTEFIRRKAQGEAFAFTCPLLKKADGGKFGKTESGNIWLDRNKTSPYVFYQYWLNVTDEDAKNLIKIFTFIPVAEIHELIKAHEEAPHLRMLQKRLAEEVTTMVHSKEDLEFAQQATEILFGKATQEALISLNEAQLLDIMDGVPQVSFKKEALTNEGLDLITFFADTNVFPSKGEARKMLQSGGVSMNKEKIQGIDARITTDNLLNDKYILFQKGKKQYYLAVFE